jgi:hypothetical protein
MPPDIFTWKMSAVEDKNSVDMLRTQVIRAFLGKKDFPVINIIQLLPLQTDQAGDIAGRGSFTFGNGKFSNIAADKLWVQFTDPVLKQFSVTIPAKWTGAISVTDQTLKITFDNPPLIQMPQLVTMGVGRSMYQTYLSLQVSPSSAVSLLQDSVNENKQTQIQVALQAGGAHIRRASMTYLMLTDFSDFCGGNPNDNNWYVFKGNDGLCVVHHGDVIEGGQLYYTKVFGPNSKAACDQYWNTCGVH